LAIAAPLAVSVPPEAATSTTYTPSTTAVKRITGASLLPRTSHISTAVSFSAPAATEPRSGGGGHCTNVASACVGPFNDAYASCTQPSVSLMPYAPAGMGAKAPWAVGSAT